jgi:hypothetical protein
MTSLLAARRKHFAATRGLHAGTKPVCLRAATAPRLKCTLWQSIPPWILRWSGAPNYGSQAHQIAAPALYRFLGSFRNYLVYLRPSRTVKKPPG